MRDVHVIPVIVGALSHPGIAPRIVVRARNLGQTVADQWPSNSIQVHWHPNVVGVPNELKSRPFLLAI